MNEVSMFVPCSADVLLPEIGEAMFDLLRHLGKKPLYHEDQTCCGQPAINAGYRKPALKAAQHFIEVFENDSVIVCPSGSCVSTVKHDFPALLAGEAEWAQRAKAVAEKTFELSQYLVDRLNTTDVGAVFRGKVAFHESCKNLRGLKVSDQPKKLIQAVDGIELIPLNGAEVCCGFGGAFSFSYPEISEALVKEKTANFINSGADLLVLSEPGCLLNIEGYLKRHHPEKRVRHLVCFLVENLQGGV
ncbi:MAG: (Fe-S)-binding protein [Proteobacteria bacterium]|nr:(Fe-S)-binding protein [Pseudomonadota bacterium]